MSKRQILMVLGVWVMILTSDYFGLPGWLKPILGVATGLAIIFISYHARGSGEQRASASSVDSYVERRAEPTPVPAPSAEITSPDQKTAS